MEDTRNSDDRTDINRTTDSSRRYCYALEDIESHNGTENWYEPLNAGLVTTKDSETPTEAVIVDTEQTDAWIRSDKYYIIDGRGDFDETTL